jgi:hypothetical protein
MGNLLHSSPGILQRDYKDHGKHKANTQEEEDLTPV